MADEPLSSPGMTRSTVGHDDLAGGIPGVIYAPETRPFQIQTPIRSHGHPLVSCLMFLQGGLFPATHAINCFQAQTYPIKELLIVVEANYDRAIIEYLDQLGDSRIRLVRLPGDPVLLSEKRNLVKHSAHGDFICIWDEDDLSDPARLDIQYAALDESRASACFLHRLTLWQPSRRKLAISAPRPWEGTMLARKKVVPDYPSAQWGAEQEMVDAMLRTERVLCLETPELAIHVCHPNHPHDPVRHSDMFDMASVRWVNTAYNVELSRLASRMPVEHFLRDPQSNSTGDVANVVPDMPTDGQPMVSIIVRSMGRPELRLALESLAEQDYPNLEVIVVDATGGTHPPLPDIRWKEGHRIRMVGGNRRLQRPLACNVGLDAVEGEWFGFLDDDDTCDPGHVSELIQASKDHPDALLVYGSARMLDVNNDVKSIFGVAFNRSIMHHGPLFYLQAALIKSKVIDLGCRFDERLDVCEDRDFMAQIADLGDFAFVPAMNFNYRPDLGTSGTGQAGNRDNARLMKYDGLLRAKWIGSGTYHTARSLTYIRRALEAYANNDIAGAIDRLQQALRAYPDDPNALNGLGFMYLQKDAPETAEPYLRRASEINPTVGEYRLNLAEAYVQLKRLSKARPEALAAAQDPTMRDKAVAMLHKIGMPPRLPPAQPVTTAPPKATVGRMDPCPCGSGKRYKHCCGRTIDNLSPGNTQDMIAKNAISDFRKGAAQDALDRLLVIQPSTLKDAAAALHCGNICDEMEAYDQAFGFFDQADKLGKHTEASMAIGRMSARWYETDRMLSLRSQLRKQVASINAKATPPTAGNVEPIHIICTLGRLGGQENRALGLYNLLKGQTEVTLWSVEPPLPFYQDKYPIKHIEPKKGIHPISGHLVFVGYYFDYDDWVTMTKPSRVTIAVNVNLLETLIERLVLLQEIDAGFRLDFTFPSDTFKRLTGLDGMVEYPPIDTGRFQSSRTKSSSKNLLVIGRHCRDDKTKFHPNDPKFFRSLVREGHRIIIKGGTVLSHALGTDADAEHIMLLPSSLDQVVGYLDSLDMYLYNKHPHFVETGGTTVLEAMSMALPVVAFWKELGVAELIQHGINGFLVNSESEAHACIRQLANDPTLRETVGRAARETLIETMARQRLEVKRFYLDQ